jgi:hypothetical protein
LDFKHSLGSVFRSPLISPQEEWVKSLGRNDDYKDE